jgi:hypothetical protein
MGFLFSPGGRARTVGWVRRRSGIYCAARTGITHATLSILLRHAPAAGFEPPRPGTGRQCLSTLELTGVCPSSMPF